VAERLVQTAEEADVVVGAGDAETDVELWQARAGEGDRRARFFGLGGGVPALGAGGIQFPWSFDLSEEEAAAELESSRESATLVVHSPPEGHADGVHGRHLGSEAVLAAIERKRPALAVCGHVHQRWGRHVHQRRGRRVHQRWGRHVHQRWGREATIGTTPVVNAGPAGRLFDI